MQSVEKSLVQQAFTKIFVLLNVVETGITGKIRGIMATQGGQKFNHLYLEQWQEDYVDFLANPTDKRNTREFAKGAGVPIKKLQNWSCNHRVKINAMADKRRAKYISTAKNTGWKELMKQFSGPTAVQALRLFFQLTGDLTEKVEIKHEHLTAEEKRRKADALLEKLRKRTGK